MTTPDPSHPVLAEATRLINRLLDGEISLEEGEKLKNLLTAHAEVRRHYLLQLHLWCAAMPYAMASRAAYTTLGNVPVTAEEMSGAMILPAIQDDEPECDDAIALPPMPDATKAAPRAWLRRLPWRRIAIILLPLMLASLWMLLSSGRPTAIYATSVDAQWDSSSPLPRQGERLPAGDLQLRSGLIQVQFTSGATMIVQGPARFRVRSDNAVELDEGRLTAMAPQAAHGFTVHTPSANVVDLGTEFGVSVGLNGETGAQVFRGSVQVSQSAGSGASTSTQSPTTLSAGDSAVVASNTITITAGGAIPQAFVRSLSAPLRIDMVDLICGGDGTTHRRAGGIDTRTGQSGILDPVGKIVSSDTGYHAVPKLQVIDGCFVPVGNMKIDSSGQTFDFGNTTGQSFDDIRAGGTFVWPQGNEQFSGVLGGVDYGSGDHGLIFLHPNSGITFDLVALARLHPGLTISRFKAVMGNAYPGTSPPANVHVLVDGVPRLQRHAITPQSGPINVDVPLTDSDRFLTLSATDDGKLSGHDWIIFGDPRLE